LRLLHLCSDSASFRVPPVFLVRPTGLRCQSELCAAARVAWVCVFFPLIDFAHRFPRRWSQNARLAPPRVFLTVDLAKRVHSTFRRRRAVRGAVSIFSRRVAGVSFSLCRVSVLGVSGLARRAGCLELFFRQGLPAGALSE
jgi:hypothetical protein